MDYLETIKQLNQKIKKYAVDNANLNESID